MGVFRADRLPVHKLDQILDIDRNIDEFAAVQPDPRPQQDVTVVNRLVGGAEIWGAIAERRREQKHARGRQMFRSLTLVAMQAAGSLKDQICGRELAHHQVEIQIEALLDNLRRDDHASAGTSHLSDKAAAEIDLGTFLPEAHERKLLAPVAIFEWIACMEQREFRLPVVGIAWKQMLERAIDVLRTRDGIAYDCCTTSAREKGSKVLAQRAFGFEPLQSDATMGALTH